MTVETNGTSWADASKRPAETRETEDNELPAWADLLEESETMVRDLIRQHPVGFVVGAAVVGFAVARLVRDEW